MRPRRDREEVSGASGLAPDDPEAHAAVAPGGGHDEVRVIGRVRRSQLLGRPPFDHAGVPMTSIATWKRWAAAMRDGVIDPSRPPVRRVVGIARFCWATYGDASRAQGRVIDRRAELLVDRKPRDSVPFDRSPHALLEARPRRRGRREEQHDGREQQRPRPTVGAQVRQTFPPRHRLVPSWRTPSSSCSSTQAVRGYEPFGIPNRGQRQTTVDCQREPVLRVRAHARTAKCLTLQVPANPASAPVPGPEAVVLEAPAYRRRPQRHLPRAGRPERHLQHHPPAGSQLLQERRAGLLGELERDLITEDVVLQDMDDPVLEVDRGPASKQVSHRDSAGRWRPATVNRAPSSSLSAPRLTACTCSGSRTLNSPVFVTLTFSANSAGFSRIHRRRLA